MNLVSLLILPAVITLRNNTGARLAIAGVALVVLLVALAFSKREGEAMDADSDDAMPASVAVARVVDKDMAKVGETAPETTAANPAPSGGGV
jgi:hypothetical protein